MDRYEQRGFVDRYELRSVVDRYELRSIVDRYELKSVVEGMNCAEKISFEIEVLTMCFFVVLCLNLQVLFFI